MAQTPSGFSGTVAARQDCGPVTLVHLVHREARKMPSHEHAHAYCTLLIDGAYREWTLRREVESRAYSAVIHPAGFSHQDEVGPTGARFFIVEIADALLEPLPGRKRALEFHEVSLKSVCRMVKLRFASAAQALAPMEAELAAAEIVADSVAYSEIIDSRNPAWLRRCIEMIEDEDVSKLRLHLIAAELGLHPVHISRTFRRRLGCGMVEYFALARLRQAARAMHAGNSLADAAAVAGFADQSHMTRMMKRFWGFTPSALSLRSKPLENFSL